MKTSQLRTLIREEARKILSEEMTEPSEQILKGAMAYFKQQTGITAGMPALEFKSKRYETINYSISLDKEVRTPVMKALFSELTLDISVAGLRDEIGGYSFSFSINYKHPDGGSNGKSVGTVFYSNGKYTGRF
jgi:hypothetical protein